MKRKKKTFILGQKCRPYWDASHFDHADRQNVKKKQQQQHSTEDLLNMYSTVCIHYLVALNMKMKKCTKLMFDVQFSKDKKQI